MDETSGGTMTPPRDHDATNENFAPVILLRPHPQKIDAADPSETSEPDSRGIWDPDAPITGLTERPSVWEEPTATELLAPAAADGRETTILIPARGAGFPRVARRRLAELAGVAAILATTAVVVVLANGGSHRHATHVATATPARVLKRTATRAAGVKTKPSLHAHHAAANRATHSGPLTRHPSTRRVRRATGAVAAHHAPSVAPASGSLSSAPPVQQATPVQRVPTPAHTTATLSASGASSCVPGEFGCW